ncbi:MAG: hypothetical protein H7Z14_04230, partial [Anaerolineae bacterium]|nr:hypothetical protein [Phycisphaerae bacterium]
MNDHFYLHAAGGAVLPAVTIGQGLPKEVNGVPAFYYWRQSAKDGEYVHPVKKFRLSIDAGRR